MISPAPSKAHSAASFRLGPNLGALLWLLRTLSDSGAREEGTQKSDSQSFKNAVAAVQDVPMNSDAPGTWRCSMDRACDHTWSRQPPGKTR
eukprot:8175853-Alexandrium_andersonii.AAC.1